jgi:hypothetical protein
MKILFVENGQPDYLCDTIMHGLYYILGDELTHTSTYSIMYADYMNTNNLYGYGFTVWGLLPTKFNDNTDIINKIKLKYFDYVIYGSVTRCRDYLDIVLANYDKSKIVFIDGEDYQHVSFTEVGVPIFKRELLKPTINSYPISFSIPAEKIVNSIPAKHSKLAAYKPGDPYSYSTEEAYYQQYRDAMYGLTHKKAGWDCMRHYEILANGCLPYFPDLADCPRTTMTNFPRAQVLLGNALYNSSYVNEDRYNALLDNVLAHTRAKLTTTSAAKYVLDTICKI